MGCLVLPTAFGGGLAAGLLIRGVLNAVTGDQQLADSVGAGVGFLSSMLLLMYSQLWFGDADSILPSPKSTSLLQQLRDAKAESKLHAAELRCGIVFALTGGVTAAGANASDLLVSIVTLGCSMLGGLAGYDFKHRVIGRRKQLLAEEINLS